jgi:hypothetical protein
MTRFARNLLVTLFAVVGVFAVASPAGASSANSHHGHCKKVKHHRQEHVSQTFVMPPPWHAGSTWGYRPADILLTPYYCGAHAAYIIG